MKVLAKFLILSLMLNGSLAFAAEKPLVDADQYTCTQLQEMLATYGIVAIKASFGGSKDYMLREDFCDSRKWANPAYIGSSDKMFCRLGFVCERRP